jgi:hypothetical protein
MGIAGRLAFADNVSSSLETTVRYSLAHRNLLANIPPDAKVWIRLEW